MTYTIVNLATRPDLHLQAAEWFAAKWELEASVYLESIQSKGPVPSWFLILSSAEIVGGVGVIENDFHNRPDLSPNICALYVEQEHRGKGLAPKMLALVCEEFKNYGVDRMYLITDHEELYEKYGWEFETMVQEIDSGADIRMYVFRS